MTKPMEKAMAAQVSGCASTRSRTSTLKPFDAEPLLFGITA